MAEKKGISGELSAADLSGFCAQLALIMKAGIPTQEGMSILLEDAQDARTKKWLGLISEKLEESAPFHDALRSAGCFPKYLCDMIQMGEESGRLDEVLDSLAVYYERNESVRRSVKSAVSYPLVMIVMMAVIIGVLIIQVLPIFDQVFRQLGTEMSAFSTGLMHFGSLLSRYCVGIIGVALLLVCAGLLCRKIPAGKRWLKRWRGKLWGTRKIARNIAAGRFAFAMSMMLSSGLDVDEALSMAAKLMEDENTREKVLTMQKAMEKGESFAQAVEEAQMFSGMYAQMIAVGFKTGSADLVMKKIAQRYEEEIDEGISKILGMIEPTLVAILSVIVGMILLFTMLPLMGIMSSIG